MIINNPKSLRNLLVGRVFSGEEGGSPFVFAKSSLESIVIEQIIINGNYSFDSSSETLVISFLKLISPICVQPFQIDHQG